MKTCLMLAALLAAIPVSIAQTAGTPKRTPWMQSQTTKPPGEYTSRIKCEAQNAKDVLFYKKDLTCTQISTTPYIPAATPSPAPSPTPSPSPTPTVTPSPSPSPAPTPTPVPSPSPSPTATPAPSGQITNPILFVTHPPQNDAFASRMSPFANHLTGTTPDKGVVRGGDLMIRYPDGSVRNLTAEAGLTSVAVREPTVHWGGGKAVFSLIGAGNSTWTMYEVTGLAKGATAVLSKLPGQPAFNNVSPIYTTDDKILFTSDAPRAPHLYPMLDEYESTPTINGFYRLDPVAATTTRLTVTPSGAFTPSIDSFGRVIFTRWDHLVQDQQAESYQGYNTASEAAGLPRLPRAEVFPEPRFSGLDTPYGTTMPLQFNVFQPWQMNQDGTAELTVNHIGRHELRVGNMVRSFAEDPKLENFPTLPFTRNQFKVGDDRGLFGIKEDPVKPGTYYSVHAVEFASFTAGPIIRFNAAPSVNTDDIVLTPVTTGAQRFRNVLPLSTGAIVAAHSANGAINNTAAFRLRQLTKDAAGNLSSGALLTSGVVKNGVTMWEIEPAEVVARTRPAGKIDDGLDKAALDVLAEEGVAVAELTAWLKANQLALIVTNDQTKRDRADTQQPQNLQVPGGVKTVANDGRVYPIQHFQIIEGQQVRGYSVFNDGVPGRRVIGQPAAQGKNPANPGGPAGSVKIAPDGSTAAFVQAGRALAWQTTDAAGVPIVRERVWVTLQPGEARTCAGCHGSNTKTQDGGFSPVNKPEALRELMRYWKVNR